jgi:hypothetical protein
VHPRQTGRPIRPKSRVVGASRVNRGAGGPRLARGWGQRKLVARDVGGALRAVILGRTGGGTCGATGSLLGRQESNALSRASVLKSMRPFLLPRFSAKRGLGNSDVARSRPSLLRRRRAGVSGHGGNVHGASKRRLLGETGPSGSGGESSGATPKSDNHGATARRWTSSRSEVGRTSRRGPGGPGRRAQPPVSRL